MAPMLYTIGYSQHTQESFIEVLNQYCVEIVVDVRSSPYSVYKPEFNQNVIRNILQSNDIKYIFLGDHVGARFSDPLVYVNGVADYEKISKHKIFILGIERLKKGIENFTIALMCAEKDPIQCHRTILISRHLKNYANIQHILEDGNLESHDHIEQRLLHLFKLDQLLLPGVTELANFPLAEAYKLQGQKIAFHAAHEEDYESGAPINV
jgi:uncharacterized protein (DUF488 family)